MAEVAPPIAKHLETTISIDRAKKTSSVIDAYVASGIVAGKSGNEIELPALPRHANSETLRVATATPTDGTVTSWSHGRMASDAELELQKRIAAARSDDYANVITKLAEEFVGAWLVAKKHRGKHQKIEDEYSGNIVSADGKVLILMGTDNNMNVLPIEGIASIAISMRDAAAPGLTCILDAAANRTPKILVQYKVANIDFELWYDAVIMKNTAQLRFPEAHVLRLAAVSSIENKSGGSYTNANVSAVFTDRKQFPVYEARAYQQQAPKRGETMAIPQALSAAFGGGDSVTVELGQKIAIPDGRTTGTTAFDARITAKKYYQFSMQHIQSKEPMTSTPEEATVAVVWRNDNESGIGRALPAAKVRPSEVLGDMQESTLPEFRVKDIIEPDELVEWEFGTTDKVTIKWSRVQTVVSNRGMGDEVISETQGDAQFTAWQYSFVFTNMMQDPIVVRLVMRVGLANTWEIVKEMRNRGWTRQTTPMWKHPEQKRSTDKPDRENAVFDVTVDKDTTYELEFTIVETTQMVSAW